MENTISTVRIILSMSEKQFPDILEELMGKMEGGPDSHIDELSQITKRHAKIKELSRVAAELKETLEAVRVTVKYLIFDLEATRRERDELRMLLEDRD